MDNEKKDGLYEDLWGDTPQQPDPTQEIGIDDAALTVAGLIPPEDAELEQILQEAKSEEWADIPVDSADTPIFGEELPAEPLPEEPIAPELPADALTDPDLILESILAENRVPEVSEEEQSQMVQDAMAVMTGELQEEFPMEEVAEEAIEPPEEKTFMQKFMSVMSWGDGFFGIPHLLATAIWGVLIIAIGTSLGRTLWLCASDVLALGKTGQEVTITIDQDDDMEDIADKLEKAGMIRYPGLFEKFADITGKGDGILVGTITFSENTVYDYNALINAMSYNGDSTIIIEVMIPEGYSCAQIFDLLDEKGVCSKSTLEKYAAEGTLDGYWFLEGVPRGHKYCLEGFLFPDTYEFYMDDDPRRILEKFLDNFSYRFSNRMVDKFMALNNETGLNLSLYEVITMASIVEKEKSADLEGYSIASVFYNRLKNAATYPYLNSDATILYATDYYNAGELVTDAQINASPYNTYTQTGLPPTPIANPGLSSLDAALDPEDTDYFYFILDRTAGYHRFTRTLAEHEQLERELGYR